MSLLDLLYLEESKSNAVISAVHQWCGENGCEIGSADGKRAVAIAVRLAKSDEGGGNDLFGSLSDQMDRIIKGRSNGLIMLVEDEPLIAMDIEQTLLDAGFAVKVCVSCSDALDWLGHHVPTAAVLDIRLKDGSCTDVAVLLETLSVPFLVSSGSDRADAEQVFLRGDWLGKPSSPEALVAAVQATIAQRSDDALEVNS